MDSKHTVVHDVLRKFDEVHARILARLEGLSDREYLWEPVSDCWTIRAGQDGLFRADAVPETDPVPAPVTTIAWRMWHIGADCLRGYCEHFFGDKRPEQDPSLWPGTADAGIRALDADWSRFRSNLDALGDEGLLRAMGPGTPRTAIWRWCCTRSTRSPTTAPNWGSCATYTCVASRSDRPWFRGRPRLPRIGGTEDLAVIQPWTARIPRVSCTNFCQES
jgi:hypothetical protein